MRRSLIFIPMLILLLPLVAFCKGSYKYKDRAEFDEIFNEVARNFGAVESAYYTFTLEFNGIPANIQEMIDTGHLSVKLKNPYTGKLVNQTYTKEVGDLSWMIVNDAEAISTSAYYLDWSDHTNTRWMTKTIWPYRNPEFREVIFSEDVTREEQLVRVYCIQLEDALEGYIQRFGELPETYEELQSGDFNVLYANPITGKQVENSDKLDPGNFWYTKITKKLYYIVGWGEKEPVYFISNDRTLEEFNWDNGADSANTPIANAGLYE